uniref:Uncharacterized protein n=1 Tax=Arundo donax TaxID=35708 RepID=A0A0A9E264_ARUDO
MKILVPDWCDQIRVVWSRVGRVPTSQVTVIKIVVGDKIRQVLLAVRFCSC